jgi:hypothetical protein
MAAARSLECGRVGRRSGGRVIAVKRGVIRHRAASRVAPRHEVTDLRPAVAMADPSPGGRVELNAAVVLTVHGERSWIPGGRSRLAARLGMHMPSI